MLRRSLVSVVAGVALLAACGDSTGPGGRAAGTYHLETINGLPLPVVVVELGTYRAEVVEGGFVLRANNSFSGSLTIREIDAGEVTVTTLTCSGTYAASGNTITFRPGADPNCAEGEYTAAWDGNTITVDEGEFRAVYRR
jgi:hypothetical protein